MEISDFYFTEGAARADGEYLAERWGKTLHVYRVAIPPDADRVAEDGSHYRAPVWFCVVRPDMLRLFEARWSFAEVEHITTFMAPETQATT